MALGFVINSSLLILLACDDIPVGPPGPRNQISERSYAVGPEGGTINALNGNVNIEIPKGALLFEEKFKIQEGPRDEDNEFVIKSIEIKPNSVSFRTPRKRYI